MHGKVLRKGCENLLSVAVGFPLRKMGGWTAAGPAFGRAVGDVAGPDRAAPRPGARSRKNREVHLSAKAAFAGLTAWGGRASCGAVRRLFSLGWMAGLALVLLTRLAGQVVLNFDDLTLNNYDAVPAQYGDGLDPHIPDVQYRTFTVSSDVTADNFVEFWNADYGDLAKVAYPARNGYAAEITFVPAEGYGVRLVSFDLAGYSHVDRTNSTLRILDATGNVLIDYVALGQGTVQGDANGPQHSTFTPNLTVAGPVRVQWGNDWDIGIDNIRFEAVALAAVPEPATWACFGAGLIALLAWRRRKTARD